MPEESDRDRRIAEEFDRYVRQEIFNTSNEYRKKHGLPLLSEDKLSMPEDFSQSET